MDIVLVLLVIVWCRSRPEYMVPRVGSRVEYLNSWSAAAAGIAASRELLHRDGQSSVRRTRVPMRSSEDASLRSGAD